jgi:hypothetical protein
MVYAVDRKGAKSGGKVNNAIKHYKGLLARIEFEGNTLWLQNAMTRVLAKFKKYAVNIAKI